MEPGAQFSGARQGVRYHGNEGAGTIIMRGYSEPEHLFTGQHHRGFGWHDPNQRVHADSVEFGQHTPQRRHDPTQPTGQLPLPGMPQPADPALHHLRQQNPSLNDLQFRVHQHEPEYEGDRQRSPHAVTVRDSGGTRVGYLKLAHERDDWEGHEGHREVAEVAVAPKHAGKGLGEAMYDLARMKGTKILHSDERSESGESFSRRVGGPALKRKKGHGADDYLGLDPDPGKV